MKGTNADEVSVSPGRSSSASRIEAASMSTPTGNNPLFVNDTTAASVTTATAAPSQWFNLDDSKVKSVQEDDLKSQFSGKESAYMLFYRR